MASPSSLERFRDPRVLAVLLFLVVACAFLPALKNDFINYDDPAFITSNPAVQKGWSVDGFKWAFSATVLGNWHPVTNLSHLTDCALFGLRPWGHHLTNVLLHALNATLLFLCLLQMTGAQWRSLFVAALFGLHPLRVESVAWVAERKDVLSGAFFFLTIVAYTRYVRAAAQSKPSARPLYTLTLVTFALGLLSKSMLVTLPCLLLLLDYWPLQRFGLGNVRRLVLEKIPFVALTAAMCLVTMRVQANVGAVMSANIFSPNQRLNNSLIAYWRYIAKSIWPNPLAIPYPFPKEEWTEPTAIAAALGLVAVSALVVALRQRRPYLAVGWFWFVGMMIPVIGLVQVGMQSMADRYTYLPCIGLSIIVAWGVADLTERLPRRQMILGVASAAVLLGYAGVTQAQLAYWSTSETLFHHTIDVTQENAMAYSMLADAFIAKGDDDQGATNFLAALSLRPHLAGARRNYGMLLQRQGRLDEAVRQLEQSAVDATQTNAADENNLGVMLGAIGKLDDAERHFHRALELDTADASAWANIGQLDLRRGDTNKAIADFQKALQLDPKFTIAQDQLSRIRAPEKKAPAQ